MQEFDRIMEAYCRMATDAMYRPAAPGDGMGNVSLTDAQLKDEDVMSAETRRYATRFMAEEKGLSFFIGCSNWETNRALVYTIEAARVMCSGENDDLVLKLLAMAQMEIATARLEREAGWPQHCLG